MGLFRATPFNDKLRVSVKLVNLCQDPINMYPVLIEFSESLFPESHSTTLLISLSNIVLISVIPDPDAVRFVSCAYIVVDH